MIDLHGRCSAKVRNCDDTMVLVFFFFFFLFCFASTVSPSLLEIKRMRSQGEIPYVWALRNRRNRCTVATTGFWVYYREMLLVAIIQPPLPPRTAVSITETDETDGRYYISQATSTAAGVCETGPAAREEWEADNRAGRD